jgi:hypothetical protein
MRDYALNRALACEGFGGSLTMIFRNWQARRQTAVLLDCRDEDLLSLGLTRGDVVWALGLPLSHNARLALEQRAFRKAWAA